MAESNLITQGPAYGYHVNLSKTWLITKEQFLPTANRLFKDSNIKITLEGRLLLGSVMGSKSFVKTFVGEKVQQWETELNLLSSIVETQPHAAYAALTHGILSKWTHLCRTTPDISHLLQPIEPSIRLKCFPQLTGRDAQRPQVMWRGI